jgi:lipoprotein-anchoring transpeptidase ErfK/SrfK
MKKIKASLMIFLVSFLLAIGILGLGFKVCAKAGFFKTSVRLVSYKNIKPEENISLFFSNPVKPSSFEGNISIVPRQDFSLKWAEKNTKLIIVPKTFWQPGIEYKIEIKNAKNFWLLPISQDLVFKVLDYPKVTNFYPLNNEKEVGLDMENPISAIFDSSVDGFSVKFIFDPMEDLEYQISEDKTKINLLSKKDLQGGKKYSISVYIKYKNEDDSLYKNIYTTSFQTILPAPIVWDKNFEIRLSQALKYTKPEIASGKYIDINLKQQVMVIFENGSPLNAYLISSGKSGMETPTGRFAIKNKANRPWSKQYSLFMPNWMALVADGKIGIHELPEWPGGYKEGQNHLGTPVSHGCVRLGVGPAKRVFDWAEIETPVVIHY